MLGSLSILKRWATGVPRAIDRVREDVEVVMRNDPAARTPLEVVLTYPGVHALWIHRFAHRLWRTDHKLFARLVSHAGRFATGVEIHPGARIGRRVFIDHGMGVVIGETASVGNDCLLYSGVLLGGTTLTRGCRHPQVGEGVVIGSNACILGAITVGDSARIGAGSVVIRPVPPGATMVGVPARVVQASTDRQRRLEAALDHANLPDPVSDMVRALVMENERLRERLERIEKTLSLEPASSIEPDAHDILNGEPLPPTDGG